MLKASSYYIDLGTANTLICSNQRGMLLNEPSIVTSYSRAGRKGTFAVGATAKVMLGKTPPCLTVKRPLSDGVIADFDSTACMLNEFIQRIKQNCFWYKPKLIISLPYRVTFHERQAVNEIGYELGAKTVALLHEPLAAAIGAKLPVFDRRGCMIVDIGGGTTEIAIISTGGIVNAQAVRTGGNHIDEAIINLVRRNNQMAIGELTAECIKITVGSAIADGINHTVEVGGLDSVTGLPRRHCIDSRMVFPAVNSVLNVIIAEIRDAFVNSPPEIAGDIAKFGLVLAGGGALLHGIQTRLQLDLDLPVYIAENPLLAVTRGGAWALEQSELFESLEAPV